MNDMIERYIFAVVKRIPRKIRDDVTAELHSIISDMLEARCGGMTPTDTDVRMVLTELGMPDELASKYSPDGVNHLIGPEYFQKYKEIIYIVIPCVTFGMTFASLVLAVLQPGEPWYHYIFRWLFTICSAVTGVFAFMTLIFAVFERTKVKIDDGNFPYNLPQILKKHDTISVAETVAGIVFSILFAVAFLCFFKYIGIPGGERLFHADAIRESWWAVLLLTALGVVKEGIKLAYRRYTPAVASVVVICNVLSLPLIAWIFLVQSLFNVNFAKTLIGFIDGSGVIILRLFEVVPILIVCAACLGVLIESGVVIYRASKTAR